MKVFPESLNRIPLSLYFDLGRYKKNPAFKANLDRSVFKLRLRYAADRVGEKR